MSPQTPEVREMHDIYYEDGTRRRVLFRLPLSVVHTHPVPRYCLLVLFAVVYQTLHSFVLVFHSYTRLHTQINTAVAFAVARTASTRSYFTLVT